MRDENPIRTLGDYSKPSHEGYRNTIELSEGNNVVPLRSDTIRLGKNALRLFQFSFAIKLEIGLNVFQQDPSQHGRILLLVSLLNSFHREGLQNFITTSLCSNNIMENLSLKHGIISRTYSKNSLIMSSIFNSKSKSFTTISISPQDEPSINRLVLKRPRDFAKPVKAISLPQYVPSTSDRRLIELENQPVQVNKISSSCEICSGPHDTQYCMENPEQDFVDYASSRLVSNFMASQDARLSKLEADFKQQQSEMTNKIDTILKAITNQITRALPSDTIKNPKLNVNSTSLVLSAQPEQTLEDEFKDLHLNLSDLKVLAHASMYNAILDKCMESLELGKSGSAFIQGEMPKRMEDPELFTLPCTKPFDTLADLGLADGTKSYPVGIVRDIEVHIGRLKLLNEFYIIDMKKDPKTPLLVGRGFLATSNAVIDYRKGKLTVGKGITRSVFGVKGIELGEEEAPYWTTLGKRESYKPQSSSDSVGARTPYYARKEFMDYHLPGEWEIARDVEINPFKTS
ncbi:MAK10-like protein [Tanacetum coccineum]